MVAVTHSISQSVSALSSVDELLCEGLLPEDARRVGDALAVGPAHL
jgi:hypothetical protein